MILAEILQKKREGSLIEFVVFRTYFDENLSEFLEKLTRKNHTKFEAVFFRHNY